ncbi:hypothetical protein ABZV14_45200 [Streptosporangium canum]|uniref:hypothetical protein n=1 Tax=Streptosporangium canum TaxID=324952 RepID=UPI0033B23CB9
MGATTILAVILPFFFGGGRLTLPIYTTVVYSMALRPLPAMLGMPAMGAVVVPAARPGGGAGRRRAQRGAQSAVPA